MNSNSRTIIWRFIVLGVIIIGFIVLYHQNEENYNSIIQKQEYTSTNVNSVFDKIDGITYSIQEAISETQKIFRETSLEVRKIDGYNRTVEVFISTIPKKIVKGAKVLYQIGDKQFELSANGNKYEAKVSVDMELLKEQDMLVIEENQICQMELIDDLNVDATIRDQISYAFYANCMDNDWSRQEEEIIFNARITYGLSSMIDSIQSAKVFILDSNNETIWSQDAEIQSNTENSINVKANLPTSIKRCKVYMEVKTKSGLIYREGTNIIKVPTVDGNTNVEIETIIEEAQITVYDAQGKEIELEK